MSGSTSAIVEHGRSGARQMLRDQVLVAFSSNPDVTGNELAVCMLGADGVIAKLPSFGVDDLVKISMRVASIQKRVSDLASLDYIEVIEPRECRISKHVVNVYRVSAKGREYLARKGVVSRKAVKRESAVDKAVSRESAKSRFAGLHSALS